MPYIGNTPALDYISYAVQNFTVTAGTTVYTLDYSVANENDIRLVINNVIQRPGASYAYSATGTTLTLTSATLATDTMYAVFIGRAVQTVVPAAGSILNSMVASNAAIESSKLSITSPLSITGNSTAGSEIRLPEDTDNGSNYVALKAANSIASNLTFTLPSADGSANQVLQTNGSGTLSFASVSSDYVRLATTTISSAVSSVEITTGFSDTYPLYVLYIYGVTVATNAALLKLQFGTGGGPTYATSSYKGTDFIITGNVDVSSPTLSGGNNISDCINLNGPNGTSNNSAYNYNATVILNNLRSTATLYKNAYVHAAHIQTTDVWQTVLGHGYNNGATVTNAAVTAIKVLTSSGNMNTGTFVLYGIKTA